MSLRRIKLNELGILVELPNDVEIAITGSIDEGIKIRIISGESMRIELGDTNCAYIYPIQVDNSKGSIR